MIFFRSFQIPFGSEPFAPSNPIPLELLFKYSPSNYFPQSGTFQRQTTMLRIQSIASKIPRRCYSIKLPKIEGNPPHIAITNSSNPPQKPRLSQFRTAAIHVLIIAGTVYCALHLQWYKLEYAELEPKLVDRAKELETTIQELVDEKKAILIPNEKKNGWFSWLRGN